MATAERADQNIETYPVVAAVTVVPPLGWTLLRKYLKILSLPTIKDIPQHCVDWRNAHKLIGDCQLRIVVQKHHEKQQWKKSHQGYN